MFIKKARLPEEQIGKKFVLLRDCSAMKGTITKGSKVVISGVDRFRGFSIIEYEYGEELIECEFDCVDW